MNTHKHRTGVQSIAYSRIKKALDEAYARLAHARTRALANAPQMFDALCCASACAHVTRVAPARHSLRVRRMNRSRAGRAAWAG